MTKKKTVFVFVNCYSGIIQDIKVFKTDVEAQDFFLKERGLTMDDFTEYVRGEMSKSKMKKLDAKLIKSKLGRINPEREDCQIWEVSIE